jgi:hypothetical protein
MSKFEPLYRATTYRLFLPGGNCDLRLDMPSETLACWLETAGFDSFAILTAYNPGSLPRDEETNNAEQARLECDLLEAGFEPYVGENVADGEDWPVEETCFVPGLPEALARELARRYGQNALVFGREDGVPKLVWAASEGLDRSA